MAKDGAEKDRFSELRERAKARQEREAMDIPLMSPEEARELVFDLQTYQIELEMQNEELRRIQGELVESRDRCSDLYQFAPVGYVTVGHSGVIKEANLTLAEMLGVERRALLNHPISAFIVPEDQDVLFRHRRQMLESKQSAACQIRMLRRDAEPIWTAMDSILVQADDASDGAFRTAISDVTERRRIESQLKASEERHRKLVEHSPYCIHEIDLEGRLTSMNAAGLRMMGVDEEKDIVGSAYLNMVADEDRGDIGKLLNLASKGKSSEFEFSAVNGRIFRSCFVPMTDGHGVVVRFMGLTEDITERKQAEATLASERERFKDFAEVAADFFWEMESDLRFNYVSGGFEEITGLPPGKLLGRTGQDLCAEYKGDIGRWAQHFADLESHRPVDDVELVWVRPDKETRVLRTSGKPVFDGRGVFQGYRGAGRDVTEAHHMAEQMAYQATHDALTGLVNRQEFEHRLRRVLQTAQNEGAEHALCYLDLDQFKVINDTCGHVAGDELLRQLGGLFRQKIRRRDTLARLGGDEFGVLMEHCSLKHALRVGSTLRKAVEEYRFAWKDKRFSIGVSMGLVPITESSESIAAVLGAADTACYVAKDEGRNRIHVYREDDAELAKRHGEMQWVSRIQRALEDERFQLSFQPISPVRNGQQEGVHYELLLRMQDEEGHTVLPGAFLPAAERYNLAIKLDGWVVRTAFEWLARHPEHVDRLYLCEINLSGHSLGDGEFLELIVEQLGEAAIPPEKVCFEVTETAAIANLAAATHFIQTLKGVGCHFALDDFGSGFSSFAYLKTLPVDFLKIDGLFVKGMADDPTDLAMVKSINEIGHTMGKRTIAEFVENEAILEKLRAFGIGVDYAQGYHIGRPKPIAELL